MKLVVLFLIPAVSFANPNSMSCAGNFDQSKVIGALSEAERSDRPEAYYQRHLANLKRHDIKESRIHVDKLGRPKVWDAGRSSEGGAVLFIRASNDDLVTIRIQATPNNPSIAINNKEKIAEIQNLILVRYFYGGAQSIKDDGSHDRYMYTNLEDVFLN